MELSPLDRAIRAARRGHPVAARRLLDGVLGGDPRNEEAVVWRARVTEEPGARAHFLRRALDLNPDNRWAADELGRLNGVAEAAPAPEGGLPTGTGRKERIHHLKCTRCGGSVEVHPDRRSKAAVCSHCGSILDLTTDQLRILGRTKPRVRPRVPIEPGMEGTFEGENHLVIGWLRYEGWDDEDRWEWDEWQLVSDTGRVRYLSYSPDEGFVTQTPVRPTPRVDKRVVFLPDGRVRFAETSPAKIVAVRGELTWRPRLDKTLQVAEADHGDRQYSIEWTADEVEVVGGPTLTDAEVWAAFGRDDLVKKDRQAKDRAAEFGRLARPCWVAAVGLLLAALVVGGTGETLLNDSVVLTRALPVEAGPSFADETGPSGSGVLGPFEVAEAGETVEVTVRADGLRSNDWTAPDVYITDPAGVRHYLFTPDLWSEGGESNWSASRLFKATEPGTYGLDLDLVESNRPTASLGVQVQGGVWLSRYYVIAAVLAGFLGFLLKLVGGSGRQSY